MNAVVPYTVVLVDSYVPLLSYTCAFILSGHPVLVRLPEPATQVACGDNHTVVLLQSGQIYTFGKHQEGQLGRQKQEEDDDTWHMVPRPVTGFGDHRKAMWVGARGNQTFIAVDESLVSETWISNCKVFSNSQMIGKVTMKN